VSRRIDYFNDPQAPAPTSVVPSANVVVVNDAGEILLIHRTDNGNWALPGGAMDLGESLTDTAIRETVEETGIEVEITGLVGIYTDPRHVILYTSDGEVRQEFSVVYTQGPGKVVQMMPSRASGRLLSRAWWRLAAAMLVAPVTRSAPMAALRRAAIACGPVPVRIWERSSS